MKTRWLSLRRRLLLLLLGGVAVAWLATISMSYLDAHHEVDELFDAELAQVAQTLLALADEEGSRGIGQSGEVAHKYQRRLRLQLWDGEGRLLVRSENAPSTPLTDEAGFSERSDLDGHWRYFSQWSADRRLQVQVSEDHEIRDELIRQITWRLLSPIIIGLPLIGLLIWFATRRGLKSLDDIAAEIASREPGQLQPVEPATAPLEIRPLLENLNHLFVRVEAVLDGERRFTADAAHELRTPIAALRAQLQVAQSARDGEELAHSFTQMQDGLSRASRLIDQMLQLARLDPELGLPHPQPTDLAELARSVCADLGGQILDKALDFELTESGDCRVLGQADWLRILVRNLVDNAVRYTPTGGKVRVNLSCQRGQGQVQLVVVDSGPGIPPEILARGLRRFQRLHGAEQPGSGLGLAIVARIAELHGARFSLAGNTPQGLVAEVRWSLPA